MSSASMNCWPLLYIEETFESHHCEEKLLLRFLPLIHWSSSERCRWRFATDASRSLLQPERERRSIDASTKTRIFVVQWFFSIQEFDSLLPHCPEFVPEFVCSTPFELVREVVPLVSTEIELEETRWSILAHALVSFHVRFCNFVSIVESTRSARVLTFRSWCSYMRSRSTRTNSPENLVSSHKGDMSLLLTLWHRLL